MTGLEERQNQEFERAKLKLSDTKNMISETQNKIEQLRAEQETRASQHNKKIKNLRNIQATQYLKIVKLSNDIPNVANVLNSRQIDYSTLLKETQKNEEEIKALQEETNVMIADFQKKCNELEDQMNIGYLQIQTDKDMEIFLEVCEHIIKDSNKLPYLQDIYIKRREAIYKRRQDLNHQLAELERAQAALTKELREKQEELAASKEKNANLTNLYVITKKLRRGY